MAEPELQPTKEELDETEREIKESENAEGEQSMPDSVALYLKSIGAIPLLSQEDEQKHARLALQGNVHSRDLMIESNLRLVVSIAKTFSGCGIELMDLIQEGNLGLMKAVERFDPDLGFRFSTYATWWIKQAIGRSISNNNRDIRLPVHVHEIMNRLRRVTNQLRQENGEEPTVEQIAECMGMPESKVAELIKTADSIISLDAPVGEDDSTMGDFIPDNDENSLERQMDSAELREVIHKTAEILPEREREILFRRFGIGCDREYTLEEIGTEFGITRERVRQLESKALRKLRHPKYSRNLRDFLTE